MPGKLLVVDGANVVGSRPDGWWRDRPGAAARLASRLRGAHLGKGPDEVGAVVLVLEGAARRGVPQETVQGVRVVHAPGSGDDAIVDVARTGLASGEVVVVTADRGLRARVEGLGASCVGPSWLLGRLDEA